MLFLPINKIKTALKHMRMCVIERERESESSAIQATIYLFAEYKEIMDFN